MSKVKTSEEALLENELISAGLGDTSVATDRSIVLKRTINDDNQVPGAWNQFKGQGQDLTIRHIATGFQVKFPAFLEELSDGYDATWRKQKAYGRMDQIETFQSVKRAISVAWVVPADSFEHAQANLARVNKLLSFLYPVYDVRPQQGMAIQNQDPLWKLSFGNLIRNAKTGAGLLGYINGITFDPNVDLGMFNRKPSAGPRTGDPQDNEYYPKAIKLNFEFTVIHDYSLGFQAKAVGEPVVTTSNGVTVESQKTSYVFNEPVLNFGNFPYKTDKYPGARNTETIFIPTGKTDSTYAIDIPPTQPQWTQNPDREP